MRYPQAPVIPPLPSFIFYKLYLFIYFGLLWVFAYLCRLSLGTEGRDYSLGVMGGPLIVVATLAAEGGL